MANRLMTPANHAAFELGPSNVSRDKSDENLKGMLGNISEPKSEANDLEEFSVPDLMRNGKLY